MTATDSEIKPLFIIIVDISGYTRFIQHHKVALLHAERIIGQLMESILEQVEVPVMAHEILGDAISLYAIDEGHSEQADKIYEQLQKYFGVFRQREAKLISECSLCTCDGCKQVGKLRLKAIVHHGDAAFTTVHQTRKISGEDIIISHRLLKNSIAAKEYILMTNAFFEKAKNIKRNNLMPYKESYNDIGDLDVVVKIFDDIEIIPEKMPFAQKLKATYLLDKYAFGRIFKKNELTYTNLPR